MQDKILLTHAKQLRNAATPFEIIIWRHLSRSQLNGHKFRRQHVIGNAIVDFFCPAKGLIVEIDGDTHDSDRDGKRDAAMALLGYRTVRYSNAEVRDNLEGVLADLAQVLDATPDRIWSRPHLNPSAEGEGL